MRLDLRTRQAGDQHARPCILDVQVHTKSWLEVNGRFAIGHHGFELLRAIQRRRSLTHAARDVGWSYRHAWDYIRHSERTFGYSLVTVRVGKGRARGMVLSPFGREVVRFGTRLRVPRRAATLSAGLAKAAESC